MIEAPGSLFAEGESGYVTGCRQTEGTSHILLDISKLLHRPGSTNDSRRPRNPSLPQGNAFSGLHL